MPCSRDAKPQDGPLPCRAFIIFATLVGIAWVLWFWRKPVRINAIGITPRPSVQNGGDAGSATMRGQDPEGKYKWEWKLNVVLPRCETQVAAGYPVGLPLDRVRS